MVAAKKSSRPLFEFGGAPVEVSDAAREYMNDLPGQGLADTFVTVAQWAKYAPVRAARIIVDRDPEDPSTTELLVEILVEAQTPKALSLWEDLGQQLDEAHLRLPAEERKALDARLGVHLLWGADRWDGPTQTL